MCPWACYKWSRYALIGHAAQGRFVGLVPCQLAPTPRVLSRREHRNLSTQAAISLLFDCPRTTGCKLPGCFAVAAHCAMSFVVGHFPLWNTFASQSRKVDGCTSSTSFSRCETHPQILRFDQRAVRRRASAHGILLQRTGLGAHSCGADLVAPGGGGCRRPSTTRPPRCPCWRASEAASGRRC